MKLNIQNSEGKTVDTIDLNDDVFGGRVNTDLMWESVVHANASERRGTHKTKNRALVSGSGKKPWRQKGTGRARVGEIRNPLWRKGGTVFGPQPRSYEYQMPKKAEPEDIEELIQAHAKAAVRAREGGYDGVEIMGSEGYLINQFVAQRTNHRDDDWGGAFDNRIRFAVETVRRTREAVGPKFIIIYRLSMLDLVDGGSTWDEVVALARAIERAGATLINTGVGWHEARIPTIATMVR